MFPDVAADDGGAFATGNGLAHERVVLVGGGDDFEFAARYIVSSLLSFQNLSQQEKMEIAEVIEQYRTRFADWPPILKTMAAGYALLNIAGEENFRQVIDGMKKVKKRVDNPAGVLSATSPAAK